MIVTTHSTQETTDFGLKLAKKAHGGDIYALIGDLGGGKTCFTKGFAYGLGIKAQIASPSFVLMNIYPVKRGRVRHFCHVDVYRLKKAEEILEVGLKEYLGRGDTITVIEWADKIKKIIEPYQPIILNFTFIDKNSRKIIIKKPTKNRRQ